MTDLTYKTDNQIIMLALLELLCNQRTKETIEILEELYKRANEQRQHIPLQIRCNHEKTELINEGIVIGRKCLVCGTFITGFST